jgi:hypothetical protein
MKQSFSMLFKKALAKPMKSFSPYAWQHLKDMLSEFKVAIVHRRGVRKARRFHSDNLRVNLGCGTRTKPGFLNVDYHPGADLCLDLRRTIPLPDRSCSLIFHEHFLEHLHYPESARLFCAECYRILKPMGIMKFSLPEIERPLRDYISGSDEYFQLCRANRLTHPDCSLPMEHINYLFRQRWSNRPDSHFECHRFAYDFATLSKVLEGAGFQDVSKREFDPDLDNPRRAHGSLFIKATKPL